MNSNISSLLDYVTAARENRLKAAHFVLEPPEVFSDLISICFSSDKLNSHKAAWILEFVAHQQPEWFAPHIDTILHKMNLLKNDSAIRPLAKIMQILLKIHYKNELTEIHFTPKELQQTIEIHFDWLISDVKVATKAYAIRTLYLLGQEFDWIHPELQAIITKDYPNHSAAYQAVSREVLKKIK